MPRRTVLREDLRNSIASRRARSLSRVISFSSENRPSRGSLYSSFYRALYGSEAGLRFLCFYALYSTRVCPSGPSRGCLRRVDLPEAPDTRHTPQLPSGANNSGNLNHWQRVSRPNCQSPVFLVGPPAETLAGGLFFSLIPVSYLAPACPRRLRSKPPRGTQLRERSLFLLANRRYPMI